MNIYLSETFRRENGRSIINKVQRGFRSGGNNENVNFVVHAIETWNVNHREHVRFNKTMKEILILTGTHSWLEKQVNLRGHCIQNKH